MRVVHGLGRLRRRFAASIAVSVIVAGIAAAPAFAHVGELKTHVVAGPYRLTVAALPIRAGTRTALAFRSSVVVGATGLAVAEARARILVREPSGVVRGPYDAPVVDGSSAVFIPIGDPNTWRSLRFVVEIAGPEGTGTGLYVPPNLFKQWLVEPWVFALAGLAAICFLQGFVRLRRRGRRDHASYGRLALFAFGLALFVLPLVSPLDTVGDHYLLSAHMLQHVLIGDAAPAVILVSLRGPLLYFAVPSPLLVRLGRTAWLRRFAGRLSRPKVALSVWAVAYLGWHFPAAYDYAATHQQVHDLEHASFVIGGLLVWALLIDPARHGRLSRGQRVAVAATLFGLGTVISDTLIFSFRPLYPFYASQAERVFSLSPTRDQQLAGLVMTVEQLITLGSCVAVLLWPALRSRRHARTRLRTTGVPA